MRCILMHKRVATADITLDAAGSIQKIHAVYAPEHLPLGVTVRRGVADRMALNDWWSDRCIPETRTGISEALKAINVPNTKVLAILCHGASLSDQYWLCPDDTELSWERVNFFQNPFSSDVGDVLFGAAKRAESLHFHSPDCTTDGNLKKRWKILDGKRVLIKGGSAPFYQQPVNEVIASCVMERLYIPHIPYTLLWSGGMPYSLCEDFVTEDTELVSAWRVMQTQKKANSTSVYQHFLNCCEALGVTDVVPFLNRMIVLDYLIANEDRHLNNFGLLRDAESLHWIGIAPIYDSGTSLGYDKFAAAIRSEHGIECKPFKRHHTEQLKLVSSFSWIAFDRLSDIRERILEVLSANNAGDHIMEEARICAIAEAVERRTQTLFQIATARTEAQTDFVIGAIDDVERNVAKAYRQ